MLPSELPPAFLVFCVAFAVQIVAYTTPTFTAPKGRRMWNDTTAVIPAMVLYRYICWIHGAVEILLLTLPMTVRSSPQSTTILGIYQTFNSYLLSLSHGKDVEIFFPPLRLIGAFLVVSGSIMRYSCYRELGRHFTLHVAVLDNHKLVTTGPYSIVRHPSYSGIVLASMGSILWHATPGSWFVESELYALPIAWIMLLPVIFATMAAFILCVVTRPSKEDDMLKKEFGKKWDEWQKRVPYRLIPGVY